MIHIIAYYLINHRYTSIAYYFALLIRNERNSEKFKVQCEIHLNLSIIIEIIISAID